MINNKNNVFIHMDIRGIKNQVEYNDNAIIL